MTTSYIGPYSSAAYASGSPSTYSAPATISSTGGVASGAGLVNTINSYTNNLVGNINTATGLGASTANKSAVSGAGIDNGSMSLNSGGMSKTNTSLNGTMSGM